MSRIVYLPASLEGVATRADKTVRLTFGTQELSVQEAGMLFSMHQSMVYLAIKEELFSREEERAVEELEADASEFQVKTPSQRLRAVMYRLYQQNNDGFNSFTRYYEHRMEGLVNHFKSKLEP
jgi:hypothetical protein